MKQRLRTLIFGGHDIALWDVAIATLLSIYAVSLVTGHNSKHLGAGLKGALLVLLLTAPIVLARRVPTAAAALLAVAAPLNWFVVGHYIRCGATLPAVFYVAFVIGTRNDRRNVVAGMALLAVNIVGQGASDPNLGGAQIALVMVPIALAFMGAGQVLRSRRTTVDKLEERTAALRIQREQNAELAVAADRARIAGDLDAYLHDQVTDIASAAAAGRTTLNSNSGDAKDAFLAIQDTGRETLTHMREVVRNLHDQAPTEPQPVLTQLDRLLHQADRSDVRLHIEGDSRLLPPGLELSGYRIVEHLLLTLESEPAAGSVVQVEFGADSLQITVIGPSVRESRARSALAAATERAKLHGGTLRSSMRDGRRETVVLLPMASSQV